MTDPQWSEVEAIVRYIAGRPQDAERMLPHLRRVIEGMPRRCWPWDRRRLIASFLFGLSAPVVAGALLAVMMGWTQ